MPSVDTNNQVASNIPESSTAVTVQPQVSPETNENSASAPKTIRSGRTVKMPK